MDATNGQDNDQDQDDSTGKENETTPIEPLSENNDDTESGNNDEAVSLLETHEDVAAASPSSKKEPSNEDVKSAAISPSSSIVKTENKAQDAPPAPASASASPTGRQKKPGQSPAFVDDPNKITLKFVFANRDGLSVIIDVLPEDTVGEAKGALLSMWPEEITPCSGGDQIRLICMGKGILMPDSRTMRDCAVPVFKTHATPINVSVKPANVASGAKGYDGKKAFSTNSSSGDRRNNRRGQRTGGNGQNENVSEQGCACVIL